MAQTHTIAKGQTLSGIAKAYGTTVQQIATANGISEPGKIRAGATLTIPGVTQYNGVNSNTNTGTTSTSATGSSFAQALSTAQNGTGRSLVSMDGHASGYTGMGYYDDKGRAYTDYGAYLREDNYKYPAGAKISPNGMYFDNGNGWQNAKNKQVSYNGATYYVPSDIYGLAPGTRLDTQDGWSFHYGMLERPGSGTGSTWSLSSATASTPAPASTAANDTNAPSADEVQALVNLLEHSYNSYIEPGWQDYILGARDY